MKEKRKIRQERRENSKKQDKKGIIQKIKKQEDNECECKKKK